MSDLGASSSDRKEKKETPVQTWKFQEKIDII
jgi:hypothetical protein